MIDGKDLIGTVFTNTIPGDICIVDGVLSAEEESTWLRGHSLNKNNRSHEWEVPLDTFIGMIGTGDYKRTDAELKISEKVANGQVWRFWVGNDEDPAKDDYYDYEIGNIDRAEGKCQIRVIKTNVAGGYIAHKDWSPYSLHEFDSYAIGGQSNNPRRGWKDQPHITKAEPEEKEVIEI